MKQILLWMIMMGGGIIAWGQDTLQRSLQTYASYSSFYIPGQGPYIETYFSVNGQSVTYQKTENGQWQGQLRITYYITEEGSDTVLFADRYQLKTPPTDNKKEIDFNITDQKRNRLPNGKYTAHLLIEDLHDTTRTSRVRIPVNMQYSRDSVQFSDIELVSRYEKSSNTQSSFYKNGYEVMPRIVNHYPSSDSTLTFYAEVYNTRSRLSGKKFYLRSSIKKPQTEETVAHLSRVTPQKPRPVNVTFSPMNITNLPSGNYELVLEAVSRKNQVVAEQRYFFQRTNKAIRPSDISTVTIENSFVDTLGEEKLEYFMKSIYPISSSSEMDMLNTLLDGDVELKRKKRYFLSFWQKRNHTQPFVAWNDYLKEVNKVNQSYGTPLDYGFETDRGRVYLQYGPPNDIERGSHEPGTKPYEVWHYYQLGEDQSNVKFVFQNKRLATNDYVLIHSDARGELSNPRWRRELYSPNKNQNLDKTDYEDHYGSQADDFYNE